MDDKDYEDYSKEIYEYLCVNNYCYVGTYKQQGLVAEMLPNYCFLTIDESYDFTNSLHRFIYSTSKDIYNEGDFINPCYLITIERVEKTKYNCFSTDTYNTIIRLGSIFVSIPYSD